MADLSARRETAPARTRCAWRKAVVFFVWFAVACDFSDRRGYTPLILAAIDGDADRVRQLVSSGSDPNECAGGPGWTTSPLVAASGLNHVHVVTTLLSAGADPNRPCRFDSPLNLAVNNGSVEAMNALIRGGANVQHRTPSGFSYLMVAAVAAQPETVPILVAAGCPVDGIRPSDGETALMIAAGWDAGMTRALLDAGATVTARDHDGATPLIHALRGAKHASDGPTSPGTWDPAIVQMLLEAGADPAVQDSSGATLLSMATETGRYRSQIEQLLIAAGAP